MSMGDTSHVPCAGTMRYPPSSIRSSRTERYSIGRQYFLNTPCSFLKPIQQGPPIKSSAPPDVFIHVRTLSGSTLFARSSQAPLASGGTKFKSGDHRSECVEPSGTSKNDSSIRRAMSAWNAITFRQLIARVIIRSALREGVGMSGAASIYRFLSANAARRNSIIMPTSDLGDP